MTSQRRFISIAAYVLSLVGALSLFTGVLLLNAQGRVDAQIFTRIHPTFPLLDAEGKNVLETGAPVSTSLTCGTCHDTAFIANNSSHAAVSFSAESSQLAGERQSVTPELARWNPITYSKLPAQDAHSEAMSTNGEMNCFICHMAQPDNASRLSTLAAGELAWVNSATLSAAGIVARENGAWVWQASAFNDDGTVRSDVIRVQDPADMNCAQCHGIAHTQTDRPLVLTTDMLTSDLSAWKTLTTGQVFASQRIANSGVNVANKSTLRRSFDIHAERVVGCTNCHYALNNPVYFTEAAITRPDHLVFDPRRMDFGEYLRRPLHEFANSGAQTQTMFGGAERTCASCHDAEPTHTWLPYTKRHLATLACETCHVPQLYAPALQSVDWTTLQDAHTPLMTFRGMSDSDPKLITGFTPLLLPQQDSDGVRLSPYNVVTAWYWVHGEDGLPVPLDTLAKAWFDGETYAAEVLARFDANGDGALSVDEVRLGDADAAAFMAQRLAALGADNPRIVGEVIPYPIHHNVTSGAWSTRDCNTCHSEDSRLNAAFTLANSTTGGVTPQFVSTSLNGTLVQHENGTLLYQPNTAAMPTNLYILGHNSADWANGLGMLAFFGVLGVVSVHGGLRYLQARRGIRHYTGNMRRAYMYSVYERQWHWLQTLAIFGLLFTGLVIHRPNTFSLFDFRAMVVLHNILAVVLVINAALSAFYHFVSGEIRQFLPRPYGFFDQAFAQAKYYLRGIFKGEPHPFEKDPRHKMNPLQQITYLVILNVLLPAQIITGALMWGAQELPDVTAALGGLGYLAPLHALIAWLFATFIVAHVYLTTTSGHTPLAGIKAMLTGWDDLESSETKGN